jgi:hypothetical protein
MSDKVSKKIAVSVEFDIVSIKIVCGDDYHAQVMYDDIVQRLQNGESISIDLIRNRETAR